MRQGFALQSTLALTLQVLTGALLPQVAWADQKCSSLGFGGAWLNPCGYCVGGNTGLERTHGRDCRGTCGGTARRDCNGICDGGAYVEPCSGQCVYGKHSKVYAARKEQLVQHRDCRGICLLSQGATPARPTSPSYTRDSCGVCVRGPVARDSSAYKDCLGVCRRPGMSREKATLMCGSCVGGNGTVSKADVVDGCGNCKTSKSPCLCDGKGEKDECGECNGNGASCFVLKAVRPSAVPANVDVQVVLEGAFNGESRDVLCVFRKREATTTETGEPPPPITAAGRGNGTVFVCQPRTFSQGTYVVTARLSRIGKEVNISDTVLTAFNNEVYFEKMEPSSAPYRREENKNDFLTLTFSGGEVPKFPLYCILVPSDRSRKRVLVPPQGSAPSWFTQCRVPFPKTSGDFVVYPSLDGQHPLVTGFNLSLYATRPQIKTSHITADGSSAVVLFDRPVNVCLASGCEKILSGDTLSALGPMNVHCRWATKQQLVVHLAKPAPGDKVKLLLNSDNVVEDKQAVIWNVGDELKTDAKRLPASGSPALSAMLTGPSVAPRCGALTLNVQYTWPLGPVEAFAWSAVRNDSAPLEDYLKAQLKGTNTPFLELDAEELEFDMEYRFMVKVTADSKNVAELSHTLIHRDVNAPVVVIYTDAMMNGQQVSPEDEIYLYAEITTSDCNRTIEDLEYAWVVDTPLVRFNFANRNSPAYRVRPFDLPADTNVTFTLRVFNYYDSEEYGEASVILIVGSPPLTAVIKGGPLRVAGVSQNDVILDGSPSSPSVKALVYQWSCLDEDLQPCYDYGPAAASSDLLLEPLETNRDVLRVMAERLEPGKRLNFTLEVFRGDNSSGEVAAASTLVVTRDEPIPLVSLDEILVGNKPVYEYDAMTDTYSVNSGPTVVVHAVFFVHSKTISINWNIPGSLVPHGSYTAHLEVCEKSHCGGINVSLNAKPGPSLCRLQFEAEEPVEQLNLTTAVVRACVAPPGSQPMTYQLWANDGEVVTVPLTTVQRSPFLQFIVPSANFSSVCVHVCDMSLQCGIFCNDSLETLPAGNLSESLTMAFKRSAMQYRQGNKLASVVTLVSALSEDDVEAPGRVLDQLLGATFQSTNAQRLEPGDVRALYQACRVMMARGDVDLVSGALEATSVISEMALKKKIPVGFDTLEAVYLLTRNVSARYPDSDQVRRNVENAQRRIEEVTASRLPKGQQVRFVADQVTHIHHRFLNRDQVTISSLNRPGTNDVAITFDKALWERFQIWKCGSRMCQGVVLVVTVHQTNPFVGSDVGTRMAPVVSVTFRTPDTGEAVRGVSLRDSLGLQMRQTGNESRVHGMVLRCFRWHERDEEWTQRDMTALGTKQRQVTCLASSTGSFTVFEVEDGLSTAAIAGIVVACLMSVFIIAAVLMFMMHKKQHTGSAKVADQGSR
ncbi:uncharacterized protein LOC119181053 isoform X2 [Rhipicephalus microplus]|uniref:uncharacterized protein LOC119181053 isoform X2 n=1 Tax=Rhipicephalus microplus TaxID=6941 RepID=UPI003F6C8087